MKKPEAVVLDMDGVIFDSEKCVIEAWKIVAEKYNIKDIENTCMACLGLNREAARQVMFEKYGSDFPYDTYKKEVSGLYEEKYGEGRLPIKPGVVELLEFLKKEKIKVALASSTKSAVVNRQLDGAGITRYFEKIICGDMIKKSKPHPDIFLEACLELSVNPKNAIAIEDSYNGIRSAYAAGMTVIMVPDIVQPDKEIKEKSAYVFDSLLNVIDFLKKIPE